MKGEYSMCDHERLRTVGDRVFCCICGKELPLDFLMNQGKPAEPPAQVPEPPEPDQGEPNEPGPADQEPEKNPSPAVQHETPHFKTIDLQYTESKAANPDEKPAENHADGKKPGKSPGRKPKAKNAE